jgi:hypothetical protein
MTILLCRIGHWGYVAVNKYGSMTVNDELGEMRQQEAVPYLIKLHNKNIKNLRNDMTGTTSQVKFQPDISRMRASCWIKLPNDKS